MNPSRIFLALPTRPGENVCWGLAATLPELTAKPRFWASSVTSANFNKLWCDALNERENGVTHFACAHSDVMPEGADPEAGRKDWLSVLLEEMERSGADVVGAVIAMKDRRGLSSTGVLNPRTGKGRKLSVGECLKLPRTFDATDAGIPGGCLLINTGLMVCKFDGAWEEKICFRQRDWVGKRDGRWISNCWTEDWVFAHDVHKLGKMAVATTAVKVTHQGTFGYPNCTAWGTGEGELLTW